jgi:chromosome segregation ATPase
MIKQAEDIDERERKLKFKMQQLEGQVADFQFQVQQQKKRIMVHEDEKAAMRERLDEIVDKTRVAVPVALAQVH